METQNFGNNSPKVRRSPSPSKGMTESFIGRKSAVINESEIDRTMKHWEEYRVKGIKIPRRSYHSAAVHNQVFYAYGGYDINAGILSDFYKVDVNPNKPVFEWEEVDVKSAKVKPGARCRHTTLVYKDKMYLFGGQVNAVENTNKLYTFTFESGEWAIVEPNKQDIVPSVDSHCALLWDQGEEKKSMIVVGGFLAGKEGGYSNAVYEYDFEQNRWTTLFKNQEVDITKENPTIPPGRTGLGAAIYKDSVYIFGGNEGNTKLNDLWKFDLKEKKWSPVKTENQTLPEPRNGHSLICYKSILILFGGILDITHEKNDIFIFHLDKGTWIPIEKDTKWIFEEATKFQSPNKKNTSHDGSRSPFRGKASPPKSFFLGKDSVDTSEGNSPTSSVANRTRGFESPMGRSMKSPSTSKYSKVKLLESLPKGVYSPGATGGGENEDGSPIKPKPMSQFQSNLEEKATKERMLRKMILLKEFEVDENQDKDDEFKIVTPALEAMQKSIQSLGINEKTKEKNEMMLSNTLAGLDAFRGQAEKNIDDGKPVKVGVKPVARDGHSATVDGGKMYIFAGDRHKMSFNDLFALNLKFFDAIAH